jgi:dTDP-4-amino-4,6-dideoxygalactose transaminase
LQRLAREHGSRLIVDSAQWFPCRNSPGDWPGDYNILSFGRGKPVNLLHGGAVICRDDRLFKALPSGDDSLANRVHDYRHRLKLRAYNLAIDPFVYGIVSRLPGLHVGETVYHPLERIERMGEYHRRLLLANIERYRHSPAVSRRYRQLLADLPVSGWLDMSRDIPADELPALLRYPLLILDDRTRSRFLEQTSALGVSAMYGLPLPRIRGVEGLPDKTQELPNARKLAARLVTLPTH